MHNDTHWEITSVVKKFQKDVYLFFNLKPTVVSVFFHNVEYEN